MPPIPVLTDPLFLSLAIVAVTSLGLSKGGFGGVGQMATPLMALVMPALEAAALLLPIMLVQDAISAWIYRRDWSARILKIMLPGALVGICAAWLLAAYVSDAFVRLGIGLVTILFVLNTWFGRVTADASQAPSVPAGVAWGSLSGFTSTLCQAGNAPYQVYVLPQMLPKLTLVGTTVLFFGLVNGFKVVPYFALGQFTTVNLTISLLLLPLAIATNFLGVWLVKITPTALFYRVAHIIVFLIALELIREGVIGLWFS